MKSLLKLFGLAALVLGTANYAKADTLYGDINGSANYSSQAPSNGPSGDSYITLTQPVQVPPTPTGTFSYNGGPNIVFNSFKFNTLDLNTLQAYSPTSGNALNGSILFSATVVGPSGVNAAFPRISYMVTGVSLATVGPNTVWTFTGNLTYNGNGASTCTSDVCPAPQVVTVPFTLYITQAGNSTQVSVNGSLSPTPEPSSLMLLGTGLFGAAGVVLKRRKIA